MVNLQTLTHKQLGDFIILSLEHGTNTQFSYEVLHEVGSRLVQINATIDKQIEQGVYAALNSKITAFKFTPSDFAPENNDDIPFDPMPTSTAPQAPIPVDVEDEQPVDVTPTQLAPTPDEIPQEELDAVAQLLADMDDEPSVDEVVAPSPSSPSVTGDDIKSKALELRQKNKISASAIKDKLAQLGAKTIVTLDTKYYDEFNAFLSEHDDND